VGYRRSRRIALAWLALAVVACNPSKSVFQLGVPGGHIEMTLAKVTQRHGYLDTELHGSGWLLRSFLPANEVCARVVSTEQGLQYLSAGSYGTLVRGDDRCEAVGIGSLREWRNRRPRGDSARGSIIPSAQASYRLVYQDEELVFLRGNFPLAGRLGFAAMGDAIAVVPRLPVCQRAIESETSTLEYFHAGSNVLTLSSNQGRCPIEGLIRPLAGADPGS
jgi:hypothetical protein